jgi:outer membrane protein TolC
MAYAFATMSCRFLPVCLRPAHAALLLLALADTRLLAQEAPRLELSAVYALARASNPMLRAALELASAKRSMEGSARLPPDPQLQIGVMNASLPGLGLDMPTSMAPAVQLMQMLPFPGKLSSSGQIARLETESASLGAEETWWEVRASAAMAFYEIYEADERVRVMSETVRLLEDFRMVAQAMYAAGEGRQSDVLRANVEVARMDAEISRMRAMRLSAASRLNALLGREADVSVPSVELPPLPGELPPRDELRFRAEERPLVADGRNGVERARVRRRLAARELWPDLTVGVQYGQRPGDMGTERMGSVMLGFSLPVFAGSRQLRMRDEAGAMERMAEAELAEARTIVDSRIGELLAELESTRTLIGLYRSEVLPQADVDVSSAYGGYRVGSVDFMTLIDAQMTVNRYQEELHSLLARYGSLVAELEMTIGHELPRPPPTVAEG